MSKIVFEKLFERSLRQKAKNFLESNTPAATLTKAVLITAAIGGVIAVGIMAPNLFHILRVDSRERGRRLTKEGFKKVRSGCYQLRRSGFMESCLDSKGELGLRLTQKGKQMVEKLLGIRTKQDKKPTRVYIQPPDEWDEKWRFIMFDIPVDFNTARDALRKDLIAAGCFQLQQSIFVYPFSCIKEIKAIAQHLDIQRYVEVCTVEDFSNKYAFKFFEPLLKAYRNDKNKKKNNQ